MIAKRTLPFAIRLGMILLATLAVLIFAALFSGGVNAQGATKCSLKTLKGAWVFEEHGLVKDGDKMVPWVAAGMWIHWKSFTTYVSSNQAQRRPTSPGALSAPCSSGRLSLST